MAEEEVKKMLKMDEGVKMLTEINTTAQRTKKCIGYVVAEILKDQSLFSGKSAEIIISENSPLFPEIIQLEGKEAEEKYKNGWDYNDDSLYSYSFGTFDSKYNALSVTENDRKMAKMELGISYIESKLAGACTLKDKPTSSEDASSFLARFKVENLEKLRGMNKKFGVENGKITGQINVSSKAKKEKTYPTLYLNTDGDLWKDPKDKFCYRMGQKSDRYKILRYLAENKGYQNTDVIAYSLEGKNEQVIRTEIGKIKEKVSHFLGMKNMDLIESKKGSGYRINPKYHIKAMTT